jgi:hypothetical protein
MPASRRAVSSTPSIDAACEHDSPAAGGHDEHVWCVRGGGWGHAACAAQTTRAERAWATGAPGSGSCPWHAQRHRLSLARTPPPPPARPPTHPPTHTHTQQQQQQQQQRGARTQHARHAPVLPPQGAPSKQRRIINTQTHRRALSSRRAPHLCCCREVGGEALQHRIARVLALRLRVKGEVARADIATGLEQAGWVAGRAFVCVCVCVCVGASGQHGTAVRHRNRRRRCWPPARIARTMSICFMVDSSSSLVSCPSPPPAALWRCPRTAHAHGRSAPVARRPSRTAARVTHAPAAT